MINCSKRAFTLAEVLVTLTIIGVVAAMTVNVLFSTTKEKDIIAKVKKNYSMFGQLMSHVKARGGDVDMEVFDNDDAAMKKWFDTYLKPRLNTMMVCYNTAGCWNTGNTYAYNGNLVPYNITGKGIGANTISAVLADGTFLLFDGFNASDMKNKLGLETNGRAGIIAYFDVNGPKKPNTLGKDIFVMVYVTGKGMTVPYKNKEPDDCVPSGIGYSCIKQWLKK